MSAKETLNNDLKAAMRAGETVRRDTLRLLLTAVKNAEIDKGEALAEVEWHTLLQKQVKQRRDSIEAFEGGGRTDLADFERAQLEIIETYLPQQMGADEVRAVVRAAIAQTGAQGAKELGKVMGPVMGQLRGKADGALIQRIVREELGA